MSVAEEIRQTIDRRLKAAEEEHGVRILYACESGSRAWGFASADSDYDVRFLYVRPPDWYLSINVERKRDVIEYPILDDFDVNGWDVRKALALFRKSNPPLLEWLASPIVYREATPLAQRMRALTKEFHSPAAMLWHYLSMARNNFREFLQGPSVIQKKYLYVLRPLLAIRWLEAGRGAPPTEFARLAQFLAEDWSRVASSVAASDFFQALDELLARKRAGLEKDRAPRVAALGDWIQGELNRLPGDIAVESAERGPTAQLDEVFRQAIAEAWG